MKITRDVEGVESTKKRGRAPITYIVLILFDVYQKIIYATINFEFKLG